MKKYEKETVISEEFYEISKEELEKIKKQERARGRSDSNNILFCYSNYILKINLGGLLEFLKEILGFLNREKDGHQTNMKFLFLNILRIVIN